MPGRPVTYVRHAMPAVEEGVDSTRWHLDDATRAHAEVWADRLEVGEGIARLITSTEPKAVETAEAIARRWPAEVVADDRLREAGRPWIGTGYRAMAHRYLRGEPHDGWEPHAAVEQRMAEALADAASTQTPGAVVIVTHGLALSLHLGSRLGGDFDQESFWSRLAFPDAWVLEDDGVLHRSLPAPIT
jgi:broad specificity phosphatase PhoE